MLGGLTGVEQRQVKLRAKLGNLLFGAGEYFLSRNDFRERYGLTIGTFVSEALLALKKQTAKKSRSLFRAAQT